MNETNIEIIAMTIAEMSVKKFPKENWAFLSFYDAMYGDEVDKRVSTVELYLLNVCDTIK